MSRAIKTDIRRFGHSLWAPLAGFAERIISYADWDKKGEPLCNNTN